jgi:hypothetical protein
MKDAWLFAEPMWNELASASIGNEKISRFASLNFFSIGLAYQADNRSI